MDALKDRILYGIEPATCAQCREQRYLQGKDAWCYGGPCAVTKRPRVRLSLEETAIMAEFNEYMATGVFSTTDQWHRVIILQMTAYAQSVGKKG